MSFISEYQFANFTIDVVDKINDVILSSLVTYFNRHK